MLINKRRTGKGFLGIAKTSKKYPYSQMERSPNMYHLGTESNFVIPSSPEKQKRSPKGIKR